MTIKILTQKASKHQRFYMKMQVGKNHGTEGGNPLVFRVYDEFVELSWVYNLSRLNWDGLN